MEKSRYCVSVMCGSPELRRLMDELGIEGLILGIKYPTVRGISPLPEVLAESDYIVEGTTVANESEHDPLREDVTEMTAQGRLGMIFTRALLQAIDSEPLLFPPAVKEALDTSLSELDKLVPAAAYDLDAVDLRVGRGGGGPEDVIGLVFA